MFSTDKRSANGFEYMILKDDTTGTYVEILPACGAILDSFYVILQGQPFNVIEGQGSPEEFKNIEATGFHGSKLSPFVCRVNKGQYHFGENDYKFKKYYQGNNALHGLLYDQPFEIVHMGAEEDMASVVMRYSYKATDPGYPFFYDCTITYQLEKNNKLTVITESKNMDKGLVPMQDGWHPYFTLGDKINDLQLEFQSKEMVVFNEELIPTGELKAYTSFDTLKTFGDTVYDNCFTLDFQECQPLCVLRNPSKKIEVEIHPDASYPYLQFYTPPHRNSIAIENISSAPDAFNNNMGGRILQPGEAATFKTIFKVTLLS